MKWLTSKAKREALLAAVAVVSLVLNIIQLFVLQGREVAIERDRLTLDSRRATDEQRDRARGREAALVASYYFCKREHARLMLTDARHTIAGLEQSGLLSYPGAVELSVAQLAAAPADVKLLKLLVLTNSGAAAASECVLFGAITTPGGARRELRIPLGTIARGQSVVIPVLPAYADARHTRQLAPSFVNYHDGSRPPTGAPATLVVRPSYEAFISVREGEIVRGNWW